MPLSLSIDTPRQKMLRSPPRILVTAACCVQYSTRNSLSLFFIKKNYLAAFRAAFLSASDSCIIDHVLTFTARGWLWRHALSLLPTPLQSVFVCISKNGLHQPLARLLPPRHAQMMQQRSATFHFCCSLCQ